MAAGSVLLKVEIVPLTMVELLWLAPAEDEPGASTTSLQAHDVFCNGAGLLTAFGLQGLVERMAS